jgi:hypothetical protein
MSISLNKINSKLYDLIDKFSLQERDVDVFQFEKMITDYHNNFELVNNDKDIKKLYYNENFEIPRNLQLEQYNDYVINRQNIYNQWLNDKNEINTNKLANYDKFNYKVIPEIYTHDIIINNNFGTVKQEPTVKPKVKTKIEPKKDEDGPNVKTKIEPKKDEDGPKVQETKLDKCDDKKKEECKKKGKECNPVSGRCIIPKQKIKENFKQENETKKDENGPKVKPKIEPKKDENELKKDEDELKKDEDELKKDEEEPKVQETKLDKCDDKKKEECKKKGKECNPVTGRCIIPKKK